MIIKLNMIKIKGDFPSLASSFCGSTWSSVDFDSKRKAKISKAYTSLKQDPQSHMASENVGFLTCDVLKQNESELKRY